MGERGLYWSIVRQRRWLPACAITKPNQEDLEALRVAGEKMRALVEAAGTNEDEIVTEFRKARRARKG